MAQNGKKYLNQMSDDKDKKNMVSIQSKSRLNNLNYNSLINVLGWMVNK
jgi:hypothetical protein